MLYKEIIAVCSQIHTKHINTLCGQNVEFCRLNLVAHKVTNGLYRIKDKGFMPPTLQGLQLISLIHPNNPLRWIIS